MKLNKQKDIKKIYCCFSHLFERRVLQLLSEVCGGRQHGVNSAIQVATRRADFFLLLKKSTNAE